MLLLLGQGILPLLLRLPHEIKPLVLQGMSAVVRLRRLMCSPTQQELGPRAPLTTRAAACATYARAKRLSQTLARRLKKKAPHDAVLFIF
jgi:hypothetical protein